MVWSQHTWEEAFSNIIVVMNSGPSGIKQFYMPLSLCLLLVSMFCGDPSYFALNLLVLIFLYLCLQHHSSSESYRLLLRFLLELLSAIQIRVTTAAVLDTHIA